MKSSPAGRNSATRSPHPTPRLASPRASSLRLLAQPAVGQAVPLQGEGQLLGRTGRPGGERRVQGPDVGPQRRKMRSDLQRHLALSFGSTTLPVYRRSRCRKGIAGRPRPILGRARGGKHAWETNTPTARAAGGTSGEWGSRSRCWAGKASRATTRGAGSRGRASASRSRPCTRILDYLEEAGISMYRLSSDFIPYSTHPDLPQFHGQIERFAAELGRGRRPGGPPSAVAPPVPIRRAQRRRSRGGAQGTLGSGRPGPPARRPRPGAGGGGGAPRGRRLRRPRRRARPLRAGLPRAVRARPPPPGGRERRGLLSRRGLPAAPREPRRPRRRRPPAPPPEPRPARPRGGGPQGARHLARRRHPQNPLLLAPPGRPRGQARRQGGAGGAAAAPARRLRRSVDLRRLPGRPRRCPLRRHAGGQGQGPRPAAPARRPRTDRARGRAAGSRGQPPLTSRAPGSPRTA